MRLFTDRFYLCVRSDHKKYAERTSVDFEELLSDDFICPQQYMSIPSGTQPGNAFASLHCIAKLPNFDLVKQTIMRCEGPITILSGRCLVNDMYVQYGKMKAIPIENFPAPNHRDLYLFSRKRADLNVYEKVLYDALIKSCKDGAMPMEVNLGDEQYPAINVL